MGSGNRPPLIFLRIMCLFINIKLIKYIKYNMQHSTSAPTKAQIRRFEIIRDFGCICCRMKGYKSLVTEVHHLLSGGRRIGHDATVGLCPWHHRGVRFDGWGPSAMVAMFGTSLALGSKPFHEQFGSDEELLAHQNTVIKRMEALAA